MAVHNPSLRSRLVRLLNTRSSPNVPLQQDEIHSIWPSAQTLRVVAGRLWVTVNGLDIILEEGGELFLPTSSRYPAVISNLSKRTAFYEIK